MFYSVFELCIMVLYAFSNQWPFLVSDNQGRGNGIFHYAMILLKLYSVCDVHTGGYTELHVS